jgi:Suppressor of fused protein (SUFU).
MAELELYTNEEIKYVEAHIKEHFGEIHAMVQETVVGDIWADIYIVKPTEERNFYTLVTMGMGAHRMDVPPGAEKLSRAELLITLPPNWNFESKETKWTWPIHWLKTIARLPIRNNSWLSFAHTVESDRPFAPNTDLSCFLLLFPMVSEIGDHSCYLPNDEVIHFYQLLPIYKEEMRYKHQFEWEALLDLMCLDDNFNHVVNLSRPNYYRLFMD